MPRPPALPAANPGAGSLVEAVVYTTLRPPNLDIYLFDRPGGPPRRITEDPALDYNGVFSPDGRWVVFTSERTGDADLYALNLKDGGPPVRLTRHHAMDDAASFAPDGQRLAFVSTRDGDADIFVMSFAPGDVTTERRALNLTRRPGGDFNPAFSLDGRRIAFSRQQALWNPPAASRSLRPNYGVDVYVMEADGTGVRRLTQGGAGLRAPGVELGQVSGSPAWSPDGKAVYYYRLGEDGAKIRRVATDGSGDSAVASSGLSPAVLSDGRIAFSRPQARPGMDEFDVLLRTGAIFSVEPNGSDLRQESDAARSCFAPDFDRRSGRMVAHGEGHVQGLVVIDEGAAFAPPDAQRRVALRERTLEVRGIRGYFPALTPSGELLSTPLHLSQPTVPLQVSTIEGRGMRELFRPPSGIAWGAAVARDAGWIVVAVGPPFGPGDASADIWKVRLDGSGDVNLTADVNANDALPHVSADARRIVFRTGGDGAGTVHVMDGEGRSRRRLTSAEAVETMPALSPDGHWVVFPTDRAGGRKLWIQGVDQAEGRFLESERLDIPDLSMHPRFSPDGKWVVFTSDRAGFNDEWPLTWFPQPYGELWAVPVSGGPAVRLTHDKWEDGPNDWGCGCPSGGSRKGARRSGPHAVGLRRSSCTGI